MDGLAPTFDGFVQVEWQGQNRSLEIEAVSHGWLIVGTFIPADGKPRYFTAECGRGNFAKLKEFYGWFLGTDLIWPLP